MKIVHPCLSLVWIGLFGLTLLSSGRGEGVANLKGTLRIERLPQPRESTDLDAATLQQIGLEMGCGQFYVSVRNLDTVRQPGAALHVFLIFSSFDALKRNEPTKRILYDKASAKKPIVSGDDSELVSFLLRAAPITPGDRKLLETFIPEIVATSLYNSDAMLWNTKIRTLSTEGFHRIRFSKEDERIELQSLGQDPSLAIEATGGWTWNGRFVLGNGGVEDVTVMSPSDSSSEVILSRSEVRSRGYFSENEAKPDNVEVWVIANQTDWRPTQRYQLKIALAGLRHDPRLQYELAVALLQEQNDGARAEAIRCLQSAAAVGYRDAIDLLTRISTGSLRSGRDREMTTSER